MQRLGLKAQGLWQLSFDTGHGWLAWQYPEHSLMYFQEYSEPFTQRQKMNYSRRSQLLNAGQVRSS